MMDTFKGKNIYFDTNIFIYFIQKDNYKEKKIDKNTVDFLENVILESNKIITSILTFSECLVKPIRENNEHLKNRYENFFKRPSNKISFTKIDFDTIKVATEVRAKNNKIKLPDAIQIATAIQEKCDFILTGDGIFGDCQKLKIQEYQPPIQTLEIKNSASK